ncbi:hypothetical protein KP509_24G026800 [Ceratopteris richardii]|uniref:Prolyl endopeptidase n=1 Tax=Ceratopteris richardii TaxID=49495 RepID=A0A8T2RTA7_CERRI|nr:hypothetical protein KP509_24G026800 [Ceratopteris richardii]
MAQQWCNRNYWNSRQAPKKNQVISQSPTTLQPSFLLEQCRTLSLSAVSLKSIPSSTRVLSSMGSLPEVSGQLVYPSVKRDDSIVEDYHGVPVADPYRWLEDVDAEAVKEFIGAQRKLCNEVLNTCSLRERFRERITDLFDYPKYDCFMRRGNKYFYFYNTGLQAQSVLYMQDGLEGEAEIFLDPNKLSDDGTVALSAYVFSENAEFIAFGLSSSGSDWINLKVMRVADKTWEPDTISWVKFSSIAWTHDNKGFFYSRYPAPMLDGSVDAGMETNINLNHKLYYHVMGTDQEDDVLCWWDMENPKWILEATVTDDGKYLVLCITEGCDPVNRLYYCDLSSLSNGISGFGRNSELLPMRKLVDNFDAQYELIANDGTSFTFLTNNNAPKYKLVRVDLENPDVWVDVIPESSSDVLQSVRCVNESQLIVCYLSDVKYVLQVRDLASGSLIKHLPLDIGSVLNMSGRREDKEIFINYASFLTPNIIYRCNLSVEDPELEVFRESIVKGFDRTAFQTTQVFVPSKDGTKIPMFIVRKKNLELNGQNPALLYGYGGFNISITPSFSVSRIVFAQHCGGVLAFANIRGGGEYGEEWHRAGSLANKQNCFDDFIACAEYLIRSGYTQSKKLSIEGASNGGLLVAACMNQRPDLFGCALAHVGVMDMLRFHKFTIGHAWTTDYGCSEKEEEFKWLIKYSPLHNVKRPWEDSAKDGVQYPSVMLLTADHDDRVVPLHSLKLLATLQHELCLNSKDNKQTNPIIGRLDSKAGHGAGRPVQKLIDEATDKYAFMAEVVNAQWVD